MKALKISRPPTEEIPDQVVVNQILRGEKEWFELLMRRYNQSLYRAIRSYFREEADVEDVMQEAYLKAFLKLEQFKGDSSFVTWLIRIGINEALQHIRNKKRKEKSIEYSPDKSNITNLFPSNNMNPEQKVIHAETRLLMQTAIEELPLKFRTVYILKEVEGMKISEISTILNISENNVKVRDHRAKKLLKEHLLKISSSIELYEFGHGRCDRLVEWVMQRI